MMNIVKETMDQRDVLLGALLDIARRKSKLDENNNWSNGPTTYLSEIKGEVDEVIEELPKNRVCFLEDELGDVLWDYCNILVALEKESGVDTTSVLNRACKKYEERISGIENGERWSDIKLRQKAVLEQEQSVAKSKKK